MAARTRTRSSTRPSTTPPRSPAATSPSASTAPPRARQSGSLTATIDGPFQGDASNPTTFPQLDLTAKVSASGAGQSFNFDGGLIATKDNAYVEYQGQAYEVGSSLFQQFKTAYEQSARKAKSEQGNQNASSIFEQFGIDPKTWLTNVSNEGDETSTGQDTIHIHGDANVDADRLRPPEDRPADAGRHRRRRSTPAQLDQVKSAIKDASVDVYSGTDDHLLRKLSLSLSIAPPGRLGREQRQGRLLGHAQRRQPAPDDHGAVGREADLRPAQPARDQRPRRRSGRSAAGPATAAAAAAGRRRRPEPGLPEVRPAGVAVEISKCASKL